MRLSMYSLRHHLCALHFVLYMDLNLMCLPIVGVVVCNLDSNSGSA